MDDVREGPLRDEKLKLTMYQAVSMVHSSSFEEILGSIHQYCNSTKRESRQATHVIDHIEFSQVSFLKKGQLHHELMTWDTDVLPEESDYKKHVSTVGTLHMHGKTVPGDLNISLLYFVNKRRLKISGGFPEVNVIKYVGSEMNGGTEGNESEIIDLGIKEFLVYLQNICSDIFGVMCVRPTLNLLNAQYDIGFNIKGLDCFPNIARETKIFSRVVDPMHELGGRRTAIKLYVLEDSKEYSCAFDHKGKVQIFACTKYKQIYGIMTKLDECLEIAKICGDVEFTERKIQTEQKRKYVKSGKYSKKKQKTMK